MYIVYILAGAYHIILWGKERVKTNFLEVFLGDNGKNTIFAVHYWR